MSEIREIIFTIILLILWFAIGFFCGILYNTRTNGNIDNGDTEYQREQQELDEQIATSTTTISNLTDNIRQEIYISTRAVGNLQELLQEIRKQRIDL